MTHVLRHLFTRHMLVLPLLLSSLAALAVPSHATPKVVVSIAPLHSWVSQVSGDLWQPELLLSAQQDPHNSLLRPSQRSLVLDADWVIWLGPQLETGLVSLLRRVPEDRQWRLTSEQVALIHYEYRMAGTVFTAKDSHTGQADHLAQFQDHGHSHEGDDVDPHLWLHPDNAQRALQHIAQRLGEIDPANATTYQANAQAAMARLTARQQQWADALADITLPYVVFHDGYQYFDRAFNLPYAGSVTLNPEQLPGLRTLNDMRTGLQQGTFGCLFAEAQYSERLVQTVADGFDVPIARLDATGLTITPGPDHYLQLMDNLVEAFTACRGTP